jgi:3-hydroxy-9,10-secoandrosta-1,3,5(10)-triene-9,17-dione monooxygenase reductase component
MVDPLDPDRYSVARQALAGIPMAVVIIGAGDAARRSCATGTAMYVSFAPARLAVALHPGSRTCELVSSTGRFSIAVLDATDVERASRAGRSASGDDKFAALDLPVVTGPGGTPAVAGAPLAIWCRVVEHYPTGDHVLFVGELEAFDRSGLDAPGSPAALVRHERRYASIGEWLSETAPEGYPT